MKSPNTVFGCLKRDLREGDSPTQFVDLEPSLTGSSLCRGTLDMQLIATSTIGPLSLAPTISSREKTGGAIVFARREKCRELSY